MPTMLFDTYQNKKCPFPCTWCCAYGGNGCVRFLCWEHTFWFYKCSPQNSRRSGRFILRLLKNNRRVLSDTAVCLVDAEMRCFIFVHSSVYILRGGSNLKINSFGHRRGSTTNANNLWFLLLCNKKHKWRCDKTKKHGEKNITIQFINNNANTGRDDEDDYG